MNLVAGLVLAGPLGAQSGRLWRADERVLVTAFHQLAAVATDARRVYAASPEGLLAYDPGAQRWDPPVTAEDGYPVGERPSALAHDPVQDALWLGTEAGTLYAYHPFTERWDRIGGLGGGAVLAVVAPRDRVHDGIYIATTSGWLMLRRGSWIADRLGPGAVPREVLEAASPGGDRLSRRDPFFEALRSTITLDERLRRWQITDVAEGREPGTHWIATWGGGLLRYDSRFLEATALPYGLLSRGVGSLAVDGDGIWVGGDGRGPRAGVAHGDADLQSWRQHDAADGAPRGFVEAVLLSRDAVWFAASDGLYRRERTGAEIGPASSTLGWSRLTERDGLPDGHATSLLPAPDGFWVGTARGLARVGGDGHVLERFVTGSRIYGLANVGDTLWIAAESGLWILPAGKDRASPAPGLAGQPLLRGRVVDVQPGPGAVWALTEQGPFRYAAGEWEGPLREPLAATGRPRALAAAEGQVWIAGSRGLARWDEAARQWTAYAAGDDLPPGPVWDVVPAGDHVWAATSAGALRLEWRP